MKYHFYTFIFLASAPVLLGQPGQAQSLPNPVEEALPGSVELVPELPPPTDSPLLEEEVLPELAPENAEETAPIFLPVDDIEVIGNTLFKDEIDVFIRNLKEEEITLEKLLDLRESITNLYVGEGYESSGAFIPSNQDLSAGIVTIQVIEGHVDQFQIDGLDRLREAYVRERISRAIEPPLNVNKLEESLRLLQVDPLFERVDAELSAGREPGQSNLIVELVEADAVSANIGTNNYRSPSIGSLQGTASATYQNPLGFGDRLSAGYSLTKGLDAFDASYSVPMNSLDGTFQVSYASAESSIVTPRFSDAGIRSENETVSASFRQPLIRSLENEFALGVGLDFQESRSFILDSEPFSFSTGPEDGVSKVRTLWFSQEWVNRDVNTVLAARSQFRVGVDAFDATVNETGTDGRFFSWLGQFQWIEQFPSEALLITRVNTQLTPDSLLPLERFSVGGVSTVRGYAQNQIVTDNAVTASAELRLPLAERLQISPFLDVGGGWNNRTDDPDPAFLLGVGVGMQWQPMDNLQLEVDYGIPLTSASDEGNSLQESGLYFSLNFQPW